MTRLFRLPSPSHPSLSPTSVGVVTDRYGLVHGYQVGMRVGRTDRKRPWGRSSRRFSGHNIFFPSPPLGDFVVVHHLISTKNIGLRNGHKRLTNHY